MRYYCQKTKKVIPFFVVRFPFPVFTDEEEGGKTKKEGCGKVSESEVKC